MGDVIVMRLDDGNRGRWAVLCAGLLIRCRTKSEAKRYVRLGQSDEHHPYKCVVRRWRRG